MYLFDTNTTLGYEAGFVGSRTRSVDGLEMTWTGAQTGEVTFEAQLLVTPWDAAAGGAVSSTRHVQHWHSVPDLLEALAAEGLHCLQVAGQRPDGTIDPLLDERVHVRAVFVTGLAPSIAGRGGETSAEA